MKRSCCAEKLECYFDVKLGIKIRKRYKEFYGSVRATPASTHEDIFAAGRGRQRRPYLRRRCRNVDGRAPPGCHGQKVIQHSGRSMEGIDSMKLRDIAGLDADGQTRYENNWNVVGTTAQGHNARATAHGRLATHAHVRKLESSLMVRQVSDLNRRTLDLDWSLDDVAYSNSYPPTLATLSTTSSGEVARLRTTMQSYSTGYVLAQLRDCPTPNVLVQAPCSEMPPSAEQSTRPGRPGTHHYFFNSDSYRTRISGGRSCSVIMFPDPGVLCSWPLSPGSGRLEQESHGDEVNEATITIAIHNTCIALSESLAISRVNHSCDDMHQGSRLMIVNSDDHAPDAVELMLGALLIALLRTPLIL
nr:hypothetical protein CFP56_30786 [Quercus suber]